MLEVDPPFTDDEIHALGWKVALWSVALLGAIWLINLWPSPAPIRTDKEVHRGQEAK